MLSDLSIDRWLYANHAGDTEMAGRISRALDRAGWVVAAPTAAASRNRDVALRVHDQDAGWGDKIPDGDAITVVVGGEPGAGDVVVTGLESDDTLTAQFAQWLPPPCDILDRMAKAFGSDAMVPLLADLRGELRSALVALAEGRPCDAHKLAGLTGTIGFVAASAAWREQDEGRDVAGDTWRTTRTAILSIDRWLDAGG